MQYMFHFYVTLDVLKKNFKSKMKMVDWGIEWMNEWMNRLFTSLA